MQTTLVKVVVKRFYESHAGFFLFVFFLMFGTVESSQLINYHLSLINAMIHAPVFLIVVTAVWMLYWIKCLLFFFQRLELPENEFLYRLNVLPPRRQFRLISFVFILTGIPVLLYSFAAAALSFYAGLFLPGIEILAGHGVMISIAALLVARKLNTPHRTVFGLRLPHFLRWTLPRPLPLFYLHQLTGRLQSMLWMTKVFSILSIVGFLQIIPDGYDIRIGLLGLLFGLAAHTGIVFEFRRFEDFYLVFMRNLPLSLTFRFAVPVMVYTVLLLPEVVLLLVNHIRLPDLAGIVFFAVGFLVFLHSSLYTGSGQGLDMEKHLTRLLGLFLISFFLVLAHLYLAEGLLLWCAAGYLYRINFYRFESVRE